jgi:dTDP-4-amino-4,6-dideoxygalactose transaminase
MIPVTKPYLPNKKKLLSYLNLIYERGWLTNHGPIVNDFESKLRDYCEHEQVRFVSNGTIALQIALQAIQKRGEVITTPYSYIATTSSIIWEGNEPVFVDVNPETTNINNKLIEEKITKETIAILATHVYGNPCEIEEIESIAKKYNIPVIYDAAHCFGTIYNNQSIFHFGDLSVTSFHATKIMHTVEGGAVFSNTERFNRPIDGLMNFGHTSENTFDMAGINGKNSEFHAAMGITVLDDFPGILSQRKKQWLRYFGAIENSSLVQTISLNPKANYNYAYFPLICSTKEICNTIEEELIANNIKARRYFSPSLNTLDFLTDKNQPCPVSESLSKRILCLPLYHDLKEEDQSKIIDIIANLIRIN